MSNPIFRKQALDHLDQAGELDSLLTVADRKGWIALLALCLCIASGVLFSIYGRLPVKVDGNGIVMRMGGVKRIVSLGDGQIENMMALPGDKVERGQIIARLRNPGMQIKLELGRLHLQDMRKRFEHLRTFHEKDVKTRVSILSQKEKSLQELSEKLGQQEEFLAQYIEKMSRLVKDKIMIPKSLEQTRGELIETGDRINMLAVEIASLKSEEHTLRNNAELELLRLTEEIAERQRGVLELLEQIELNNRIISPYAGTVIELMAGPGSIVSQGQPIVSVENPNEKQMIVLFLDPYEGKKVRPGMVAHISPSTVKKEEYGSMVGVVSWVSDYAFSLHAMTQLLGNEGLAQTFSKEAPPIAVMIDLVPDPRTQSGFRWTSAKGPEIEIETGTLCNGTITIETRRPITFLFPLLKKTLGASP